MCWLQGEDHVTLPQLNRKCIKKWQELNTDWQVNFLCNKTISQYVPEYFEIVSHAPNRIVQHRADLLRLLLLSKYGGVWVDASVYPMLPLSKFYHKIVNKTGFFTYRFMPRRPDSKGNRETVVWFLCANSAKNYLIEQWKNEIVRKFKEKRVWKYFTMSDTLCQLYDTDPKVKFIINNMVQINEKIPHAAYGTNSSYMHKRPQLKAIND